MVYAADDLIDDRDLGGIPNTSIRALGQMGRRVVPALLEAFRTGDGLVRWVAASAIAELGRDGESAIPALKAEVISQRLDEKSMLAIGMRAAEALGAMCSASLRDLTELAQHKHSDVRLKSLVALGGCADMRDKAVAVISRALTDADVNVRRQAIHSIGRLKPSLADIAPALRAVAEKDPDAGIREFAASTLASLSR